MSKRKPDEIIVHRIELQDKERDLLSHLVYLEGTTKAFNNVAEPIVKLLNDVTGTVTVLSILAAAGITGVAFIFLASDDVNLGTAVDQFLTQREQAIVAQGLDIARAPIEGAPGLAGELAQRYGILGILRRVLFPDD